MVLIKLLKSLLWFLQARAALRDVGRVFEMPHSKVDRIAKLIPYNPANPVSISVLLRLRKS